jgi:hypothetical protein
MKNLITALSVVLITGLTPALANETNTNPRTEAIFSKQFTGAENVKWTSLQDGLEKVTFTLAGTRVDAYFDNEGELLGTVRNLFFNQLPLTVMQTINNKFTSAVVIESIEISNEEGINYMVVLEQKDKKYSIRLNSRGDIIETLKEKKK